MEGPEERSNEKTSKEKNSGICFRCGRHYTSNRRSKIYCSDSCKTLACNERKVQRAKEKIELNVALAMARERKRKDDQLKEQQQQEEQEKIIAQLNEALKKQEEIYQSSLTQIAESRIIAQHNDLTHLFDMEKLRLEYETRKQEAERESRKAAKDRAARRKQNQRLFTGPRPARVTKTEDIINALVPLVKKIITKK